TWGGDTQKFAIVKSGPSSNWQIALKTNPNKCVGPTGLSTANGTRLEVQDCNGSNYQAWTVTADANTGAFVVKNVASNRCLEVAFGNPAPGALMQLYDCNGLGQQKFKVSATY